LKDLSARTNFA